MNFPTDTIEKLSPTGTDKILIADSANLNNTASSSLSNIPISNATQTALNGKEPSFTKNTAFNKNFGTIAGTVSEGNHTHTELHTHPNKTVIDGIVDSPVESITAGTNINVTRNGNDVTIDATTSGAGGHTIQDEGVSLSARTNLDFVGTAVTATDDSANDKTIITINTPSNTLDGLSDTTITTPSGGQALTYNSTNNVWENTTLPGGGDMLASTYDPNSVGADVYNQDNMVSGNTNVNYTATEQTKLSGIENNANNYTITSDIDDATPAADKVYSSNKIQTELDNKEPSFTKNTGFNLNLGTTTGTVLEGNTNVGIVGTKEVDETNIADAKILAYNTTSGKVEYITPSSGGGNTSPIYDGYIAGEQVIGTVFFTAMIDGLTTNKFKIVLGIANTGADFIAKVYQNDTAVYTATIIDGATATNGLYISDATGSVTWNENDKVEIKIEQIGSNVNGSDFSFQLI